MANNKKRKYTIDEKKPPGRRIVSAGIPRIRLNPAEFEIIKQYRAIQQSANEMGLDEEDVKHGWLKTKDASLFFTNPAHRGKDGKDGVLDIDNLDFKKLLGDIPKFDFKVDLDRGGIVKKGLFDRVVLSDVHIGMDPTNKGRSLYDGLEWNKKVLFDRLEKIVEHVLENQKSNVLYIVDLGDFLDGFNGQTTRGGHSLPQNMSNQDCFDAGFSFKVALIENLIPHFDHIHFRNINNDNHSADFAYFVNSAFKSYCDAAFPQKDKSGERRVQIVNQTKFIDYEIIGGKYCFVTTHGKDSQHMKGGFKPKLDAGQVNKILGYLNTMQLINRGYDIIFEKGDSHQYLFDSSTSDQFKYYNYPALSPSSDWVATNFQVGQSGFIHFNYYEKRKSVNEYFFD